MTLYLTSVFAHVGKHILDNLNTDVQSVLVCNSAAALYPGYQEDTIDWLNADSDVFKDYGLETSFVKVEKESPKTFREKIAKTDCIYFGGGNPFLLLDYLHQINFKSIINEGLLNGKTLIGGSAGATIFGPDNQVFSNIEDSSVVKDKSNLSLNLVPFIPIVHWGNNKFAEIYKKSFDLLYKSPHPLLTIGDNQYCKYEDDTYTLVTVS